MDNYSLSDLRAAVDGGNDNWGGGAWWIIILFLFVFMGGGWGMNRQGEFGQYATASSQQEILFGQQFGQLNDRLTNVGNGICNLGYEMQGNAGSWAKKWPWRRTVRTWPLCRPETTSSLRCRSAAAPRSGLLTASTPTLTPSLLPWRNLSWRAVSPSWNRPTISCLSGTSCAA